jgi:hypothetical protein
MEAEIKARTFMAATLNGVAFFGFLETGRDRDIGTPL